MWYAMGLHIGAAAAAQRSEAVVRSEDDGSHRVKRHAVIGDEIAACQLDALKLDACEDAAYVVRVRLWRGAG